MPMMALVASELNGAGAGLSLSEFGLSLSIASPLLFRAWRRDKTLSVTFSEGGDETSSTDSASKEDPSLVSGLSLLLWLGEDELEKLFGAPTGDDLGALPSEEHLLEEAEEEEDGDLAGEEALKGVRKDDLSVANAPTTAMKTNATTIRSWRAIFLICFSIDSYICINFSLMKY
ncbi:hypothetical protein J1N35_006865 [Gossypium stocksii]|uniref:Uncharacterized protein n=1 Tax=Gossypium stocksii TaxID=47602 RepID=A0A9D4ACX7_9ROSI|nr:hypothetical protein J1N35_006865 [Gossypium stocksii]